MNHKNFFYNFTTVLFVLLIPFLGLILIIPISIIYIYIEIWMHKSIERKQTPKSLNILREKQLNPIFENILPKDIKSALDIGSGRGTEDNFLVKRFNKYITLDIRNSDIEMDLNLNSKIPLKKDSVDLIIMSNILEHLADPLPIMYEANKISKKYILIGLPNEYPLITRILILFGKYDDKFYPLGHKHKLSIFYIEMFLKDLYGDYLKKEVKFCFFGEKFIPKSLQNLLMNLFPSLFIGEVFYLIKKSNLQKEKFTNAYSNFTYKNK